MNPPRIVVDNSAVVPAFFAESGLQVFDTGLVTNRSRSLVEAIRNHRVRAFVPPSFHREFLNVTTRPLDRPGGRTWARVEEARAQWQNLLELPLKVLKVGELMDHSGTLAIDDRCPAADAWYVAAAVFADATFWMSHEHRDGLVAAASRHVQVRLLSRHAPGY